MPMKDCVGSLTRNVFSKKTIQLCSSIISKRTDSPNQRKTPRAAQRDGSLKRSGTRRVLDGICVALMKRHCYEVASKKETKGRLLEVGKGSLPS